MSKYLFLAVTLLMPCLAFPQLSKGEGKTVTISDGKFSCYLPKYFEIQENPPGIMHTASGTFIIAVKVPEEKNMSLQRSGGGLDRSFFEDPGYKILSLEKQSAALQRHAGPHAGPRETWLMRYELEGFEFERYTTLVTHGHEQYVIIGNYSMILKNQVVEEVRKAMESFKIH